MINKTLPIIAKKFIPVQNKTVIECDLNGRIIPVWADGDKSGDLSILCNITVNEVGDQFIAAKDSKTIDDTTKKPLYKKGDTVTRQKESYEYKSFVHNGNSAIHLMLAANAFGITPNVVMQA
jgi:hypothetical protein